MKELNKILMLVMMCSIFSFIVGNSEVKAQGDYFLCGSYCTTGTSSVKLIGGYIAQFPGENSGSSVSYRTQTYKGLTVYTTQLIDGTIYPDEEIETNGFAVPTRTNSGKRLQDLIVYPSLLSSDYFGATLCISVEFSGYTHNYYIDILGPIPATFSSDDFVFEDGTYSKSICQGETVTIGVDNSETPFPTSNQGYSYTASYSWNVFDESTNKETFYTSGNKFDFKVESGKSNYYSFFPMITYEIDGEELCTPSYMENEFLIQYDSPISLSTTLNGMQVANNGSITICEGESVVVNVTGQKDDSPHTDMTVELFKVAEDGTETSLQKVGVDGPFDFTLSPEVLTANSGTTTHTFKLVSVDNTDFSNACEVSQTFQVIVNEKSATIAFTGSDDEVCLNEDVDIQATVTGKADSYSYTLTCNGSQKATETVSMTNGQGTISYTDNSVSPAGTRTYTLTIDNNGCQIVEEHIVTVNPLPDFSLSADAVCVGEPVVISITNNTSDTYEYTVTPGSNAPSGSLSGTTYTTSAAMAAGTFSYTVKAKNTDTNCESEQTVSVTVNALPEFTPPTPAAVCAGEAISITMPSETGYTYSVTAAAGSPAAAGTSNGLSPNAIFTTVATNAGLTQATQYTYTITATATDGTGCEASEDVKVTVNPLPVLNILNKNVSACSGQPFSIEWETVAGYGYNVAPVGGAPAGSVSDGVYTVNQTSAVTAVTVYEYTVTAALGSCSVSETVKVTVNPLPTVSITNNITTAYCEGAEVSLSATTNASRPTYLWTLDGNTVGNSATLTHNPTGTGNFTYVVTVTDGTTGCQNSEDITITVNTLPTATITPAAVSICEGTLTTLTGSASDGSGSGYSYLWTGNGVTATSQNQSLSGLAVGTHNYTLVVTDGNGCQSDAATATVTVNTTPTIRVNPAKAEVCSGVESTVELTVTVTNGATINWPAGITATNTSGNTYSISGTWTSVQILTLTASLGDCESNPATFEIVVNQPPTATISGTQSYCLGEDVTLSAATNATTPTYVWYCNNAEITGQTSATLTHKPEAAGTYNYTVTVTDRVTGCSTTSTAYSVTINALPTVTISGASEMCEGAAAITLTANPDGNGTYNYTWSTGATTSSINVTPSTTTTYRVSVTDVKGCQSAEAEHTVTVNLKPQFTMTANPAEVCEGETATVTFTPNITNGVTIQSYTWSNSSVINNEITQAWNATNNSFTVTATSDKGCVSDEVSVSVTVNPLPVVPSLTANYNTLCSDYVATDLVLSVQSPVGGYTYEWQNAAGDRLGVGTTYTPAKLTETTTFYVLAKTTQCDASSRAYITITINRIPEKPAIDSGGSMCAADATGVTLSVNNPITGLTYTWYETNGTQAVGTGVSITVKPTSTTSYYVVATDGNGCQSEASDEVVVSVNPLPELNWASNTYNVPICRNGTRTLEVSTTSTGLTYTWTVNGAVITDNSTNTLTVDAASLIGDPASPTSPITVSVVALDGNGCQSNTLTLEIPVIEIPELTVPNPIVVCDGAQQATITVTSDKAANNYINFWIQFGDANDNGGLNVNPDDPYITMTGGHTSGDLTFPLKDNYTRPAINAVVFSLEAGSQYMCSSTPVELNISVLEDPQFAIVGDDTYCEGTTLVLSLTATRANAENDDNTYTYQWYKDNAVITGATSETYTKTGLTTDDAGSYTVQVSTTQTNVEGDVCTFESASFEVKINEQPVASISGDGNICVGSNSFTVSGAPTGNGYSYAWTVGGQEIAGQEGMELTYEIPDGAPAGATYQVGLVVTDGNGCVSEPAQTHVVNVVSPATITAVSTTPICADANSFTFTVVATPSDGLTYKFFTADDTPITTGITQTGNEFTVSTDVMPEGTYKVSAVNGFGCESEKFEFHLNVLEIELEVTPSLSQICRNSTTPITFTPDLTLEAGDALVSYTFSFTDPNGAEIQGGSEDATTHVYSITPDTGWAEGEYTLTTTVITQQGCTTTVTTIVRIIEQPEVSLTAEALCAGQPEMRIIATEGLESYTFYVNNNEVERDDNTSNVLVGTFNENDVITVTVTSGDCQGTSEPDTVHLFNAFTPTLGYSYNGGNACAGAGEYGYTITTNVKSAEGGNFMISSVQVVYVAADGTETTEIDESFETPDETYTFSYAEGTEFTEVYAILTSTDGCVAQTDRLAPYTLNEIRRIDVTSSTGRFEMCSGTSITLAAAVTDAAIDGVTYTYEFSEGGNVLTSNSNTCSLPEDLGEGEHTITVKATDTVFGCEATTTVEVIVYPLPELDWAVVNPTTPGETPYNYVLCDDEYFEVRVAGSKFYVDFDKVGEDGVHDVYYGRDDVGNWELITKNEDGHDYNVSGLPNVLDTSRGQLFEVNGNSLIIRPRYKYEAEPQDFSVTVIDPVTGCMRTTKPVTISYKAPINLSLVDADGNTDANHSIVNDTITLCVGDKTILSATRQGAAEETFDIVENGTTIASGVNSYEIKGEEIGTREFVIRAADGCSRTLAVVTNAAPAPEITVSQVDGGVETPMTIDETTGFYHICSGKDLKLVASGASKYELVVTRDGVDVTDQFDSFHEGNSAFEQVNTVSFVASEDATEYNNYEFTYTFSVGSCVEVVTVPVRVLISPDDAGLELSHNLVIAGTTVTATVTPLVDNYTYSFTANGEPVTADDGTPNIYTFNPDVTTAISVTVTNAHGCFVVLQDTVQVLEGIEPKDVIASAEYYCSNTEGVSISVVDPQPGITYELVGCEDCEPITCVDTVVWTGVKVPVTDPLLTQESIVFSVIAYHSSLPSEKLGMNNDVTVTRVDVANVYNVIPNETSYSCNNELDIKLDGFDADAYYYLLLNEEPIVGPVQGTGSELILLQNPSTIGRYTVVAHKMFNSPTTGYQLVCPVEMNGAFTIDVEEAQKYQVQSTPENGNICEDDEVGVAINLAASQAGYEYYLLLNNNYITTTTETSIDTLKAVSTADGELLSFGSVTEPGIYTVVCHYNNGCRTMMEGSVTVTVYQKPANQTVEVTNDGHFCEGESGVTITVGGQQPGYIYQLYRDGIYTNVSHEGDGDGAFTFENINVAGTYTVEASIPNVVGGCSTVMETAITVIEDPLPRDITILIGQDAVADTICVDESTDIKLYNTEAGVVYTLYENDNKVEDITADGNLTVFTVNPAVGDYVYKVLAVKASTTDGIEKSCSVEFEQSVTLKVLDRPSNVSGSANVYVFTPGNDDTGYDACYGSDIVVGDATEGLIYSLYKTVNGNHIEVSTQKFIATGNLAEDRFFDIRDQDGYYVVYVGNGYCEDLLTADSLHIQSDKFVEIQTVIAESSMCQGDLGATVSLVKSEDGVIYTLYDQNNEPIEEYSAVGEDGFTFNTLLRVSGTYYVTGRKADSDCESRMIPDVNFTVNPLPVSHELTGPDKYCGDSEGVILWLSGSELATSYTLYSEAADGTLTPIQDVYGTGDAIEFPTPVKDGTYVASSRNYNTGCTSSMKGRIVVTHADEITDLGIQENLTMCDTEVTYTIDQNLVAGATYYLVLGDASPEAQEPLYEVESDGTTPIEFVMTEGGFYTVWASYDEFGCLAQMGTIDVTAYAIDIFNVTADDSCDGQTSVKLEGSQDGVNYTLMMYNVADGTSVADDRVLTGATGTELEWSITTAEGVEYYVVASVGECTKEMNGRVTPLVYPPLSLTPINIEAYACGYDPGTITLEGLTVGATYYIMDGDESPENATPRYITTVDDSGSLTLRLTSGTYTVWASYANYACLQQVPGSINVTAVSLDTFTLTTNISCDGQAQLTLNGSQVGVSYTLMMHNTATGTDEPHPTVLTGSGEQIVWTVTVSDNIEYYYAVASVGDCSHEMNGHVTPEIYPALNPGEVSGTGLACEGGFASITLRNLTAGNTYYIVNGDNSPLNVAPTIGPVVSPADTMVVELPAGTYTVWVSYENYACLTQAPGSIVIDGISYTRYEVSSNQNETCGGSNVEIYLNGSDNDVTYSLVGVDGSELLGNGSRLTWTVTGTGQRQYEVVATKNGECPTSMGTIVIDFDQVTVPDAWIDMYIVGEKYTGSALPEVCQNTYVSFLFNVSNLNVAEYICYINGRERRSNSNMFIPSLEGLSDTVKVSFSIMTENDCFYADLDSIFFIVRDTELPGNPLIAKDNYPEYCADEEGVKIGFLGAEKGNIYRLYMKSISEYTADELMDIQEIPDYYIGATRDTLWFDGWGNSGTSVVYATAGTYYVTVETLSDGCQSTSNILEVIENPLPGDSADVYYAIANRDVNNKLVIDEDTKSDAYGLLDAGYIILEHAELGVQYELVHLDNGAVLDTMEATADDATLFFGPILSKELDQSVDSVDQSLWGEGVYTIRATNKETGCSRDLCSIEFVEEELVAYNVYLYLNQSQTSVKQLLYPRYPNKGNHQYIDWSSKIDVVYAPDYETSQDGSFTINNEGEELYPDKSGYSSIYEKSNIVFELLPAMKDVVVNDTVWHETRVEGCDSVFFQTITQYYELVSDTIETIVDTVAVDSVAVPELTIQTDTIWHDEPCEACLELHTDQYVYFTVGEATIREEVSLLGEYGFDDFNPSTPDLETMSRTGMFVYNKRPSFYGQEEIRYRIYNLNLQNVRISNEATITILCGNQAVGDSSTVFLIPNAFSPNGDGYNDVFKILLPYKYQAHSESSLEVFNRWGTLVYRSSGNQYGVDCPWWDGTSGSSNMLTLGEKLPSGTYFYVYTITFIDAANSTTATKKLNGYIELRR